MVAIPSKSYLIIDDNTDILLFLSDYLKKRGAKTILSSSDSYNGIDLAKKNKPDMVILDYEMKGGLNGLQILNEFHRLKLDFPVILISGHDNFELGMQAAELGVSDFVNEADWYEVLDLKINNTFYFGHSIKSRRTSSREIISANLLVLRDILKENDNYSEIRKILDGLEAGLDGTQVDKTEIERDLSMLKNATAGAGGNLTAHAIIEGISAIAGMF